MIAFTQYQFRNYFKSYQFIPPILFFVIWIIIQYLYKGQPILSSYASSSIGLLIISCWLTISIWNLESLNEKYLLFTQLESKLLFLISKWFFISLIHLMLILLSLFYPLILNRFSEDITLNQYIIALTLHIVVSIIGMLISTLIHNINFLSYKYTFLFIALIIIVSLSRPSLVQSYSLLNYILWAVPPIGDVITLFKSDTPDNAMLLIKTFTIFIYIIILIGLNIMIFTKSDQK